MLFPSLLLPLTIKIFLLLFEGRGFNCIDTYWLPQYMPITVFNSSTTSLKQSANSTTPRIKKKKTINGFWDKEKLAKRDWKGEALGWGVRSHQKIHRANYYSPSEDLTWNDELAYDFFPSSSQKKSCRRMTIESCERKSINYEVRAFLLGVAGVNVF